MLMMSCPCLPIAIALKSLLHAHDLLSPQQMYNFIVKIKIHLLTNIVKLAKRNIAIRFWLSEQALKLSIYVGQLSSLNYCKIRPGPPCRMYNLTLSGIVGPVKIARQ